MKDDDLLLCKISRKGAKPMEIALAEQLLPSYLRVGPFLLYFTTEPET
jgi:hypothetical protein